VRGAGGVRVESLERLVDTALRAVRNQIVAMLGYVTVCHCIERIQAR
jgi:hypothetical protein